MSPCTRRSIAKGLTVLPILVGFATLDFALHSANGEEFSADRATIEKWMDAWSKTEKRPFNPLFLSRFADPIYFLTQPIIWRPDPGQEDAQPVTVPTGFVTDFASIPRAFWSLLKPDGNYAWAAVVHDYLYWTQTTSKDVADKTLLYAMEDFGIATISKQSIYQAVHLLGQGAWNENANLKVKGEKRILKRYPTDPRTTWDDWRKDPSNFE
jgi:hypothetical protein